MRPLFKKFFAQKNYMKTKPGRSFRLLVMAEEARTKAMSERGGSGAAIAAITAIAKLSGLWVEKSETTNKTGDLNSLSDAELAAVILGDKRSRRSSGPRGQEAELTDFVGSLCCLATWPRHHQIAQ
jgi:hypothetical protein